MEYWPIPSFSGPTKRGSPSDGCLEAKPSHYGDIQLLSTMYPFPKHLGMCEKSRIEEGCVTM